VQEHSFKCRRRAPCERGLITLAGRADGAQDAPALRQDRQVVLAREPTRELVRAVAAEYGVRVGVDERRQHRMLRSVEHDRIRGQLDGGSDLVGCTHGDDAPVCVGCHRSVSDDPNIGLCRSASRAWWAGQRGELHRVLNQQSRRGHRA
jgi:hypothetical protein